MTAVDQLALATRAHRLRGWRARGVALVALAVIAALGIAVAVDAPLAVRLPLTVVLLTVVPGLSVVGLVDIEISAAWVTLVVAISFAVSSLLSVGLAALGWVRPGPTVVAFAVACGPFLLTQLVRGRR